MYQSACKVCIAYLVVLKWIYLYVNAFQFYSRIITELVAPDAELVEQDEDLSELEQQAVVALEEKPEPPDQKMEESDEISPEPDAELVEPSEDALEVDHAHSEQQNSEDASKRVNTTHSSAEIVGDSPLRASKRGAAQAGVNRVRANAKGYGL